MLIFYLRLQNFEDFSVDRLIYNLSGALPSELDWQQERGSRKQSPSAITCRHQKELVNSYYQSTIIINCNNYYKLQHNYHRLQQLLSAATMRKESKHWCFLLCHINILALLSVSRCFMNIKSKSESKIGNDLSCMGRRKGGLKGCRILKGKKLRPGFSFPPVQTYTTGRDGDFRSLLCEL